MNYISLLTQEEKADLCKIIDGRYFKNIFRSHEPEFTRIQGGFRAKSLSKEQALSIAINNIDESFIAMEVNKRVDNWLKEIQEKIEKLEGEGSTHDTALAATLLDSVFANNVDLYLKLAGKALDMDARSELKKAMAYIEEKHHLLDIIETTDQSVHTIKLEYEHKIQELEQERNALRSKLAEANEKITELQVVSSAVQSDNTVALAQFDDTAASVFPSVSSDEIVSLCSVFLDYNGNSRLIRYADLNYDGRFHIFRKSKDSPPYFNNRDKLYYKDGPSNEGFYGIWTWTATPSAKVPSRDHIDSQYNTDLDAIEVIVIAKATNLDNLINLLKNETKY
ncbi:MAG: hypothetical protein PHU66_09020, partial [Bacteroidaceae bacterium]|nr:hypothetical protein [Bacteroidaceae bacterium]